MDIGSPSQAWAAPTAKSPIVSIGAGGIVRDAHMPAYRSEGFEIAGVYDPDQTRAKSLASDWGIERVFARLDEAAEREAVFDIATPPSALPGILRALPRGAVVLMQKPMGEDLGAAREIREIVRDRNLRAAVNFQLRFSPKMLALQDAIQKGWLGELLEIEVSVNIHTPWSMFPFLKGVKRVELSLHSIHYLDMIRALAGNPKGVFCRTMADPRDPETAQSRTSAMLDYGHRLRVLMTVNHNHAYGPQRHAATWRVEGTEGAAFVKMGVLYDYPHGEPDELWLIRKGGEWAEVPLSGRWFPDAFAGRMRQVQRVACGDEDALVASAEDAFQTMALVEACFDANEMAGAPLHLE